MNIKKYKFFSFVIFLAIILMACTPAPTPPPTETPAPTATFTPVVTSPIPTIATPLPTQLTIVPTLNSDQAKEQEEIKSVIEAYFEIHYQVLSIALPENFHENGFGDLVSGEAVAKDFLTTELAKLATERKWYELKVLEYAEYEYSLTYTDIKIGISSQTATVTLLDDFTVITKRAIERNPDDPSIIRGGLAHEIVLHNEKGYWKIVSDIYQDGWWRQYRQPGRTTEEILREIDKELQQLEAMPSPIPWSSPTP